jgi:hypothetical protein
VGAAAAVITIQIAIGRHQSFLAQNKVTLLKTSLFEAGFLSLKTL